VEQKQDFYDYLRTQFTDLESAKKWYQKWKDEMEQELEGYPLISCRAMAYHISTALEGKTEKDDDGSPLSDYTDTKYGRTIFLGE
jgi:hypothetical protein